MIHACPFWKVQDFETQNEEHHWDVRTMHNKAHRDCYNIMPAENITTSEKSEDLNELSISARQKMLANAAEDKTVKSRGKKMQKTIALEEAPWVFLHIVVVRFSFLV